MGLVGQLIATMRKDVLPKSPLGKALGYAENRWPAMARYLASSFNPRNFPPRRCRHTVSPDGYLVCDWDSART